jgi:CHAD domain-containing protein
MAYRFKQGEPVSKAIKRMVRGEIRFAVEQLSGRKGADRDEAIHEARKSVKKIRALLRLVQAELGNTYRFENTRFRDVGRRLSEFRNAAAMLELLDSLEKKYKDKLKARALDSVRRGLVARKKQIEREGRIDDAIERLVEALIAANQRIKTWPLRNDGFAAISPGLQKAFRRGRQMLDIARNDPTDENFHTWRKRVKDHWYDIRLLENLWTPVMHAYEKSLNDLQTWLGDDHNLVVLWETVSAEPKSYGTPREDRLLFNLIDEYQKELRDNSLSLGPSVYDDKPRQFTVRMKRLWNT